MKHCFTYEIYDEGFDEYKSALIIREIFSATGILNFYIELFKLEIPFYDNLRKLINDKSPEEIFFSAFEVQGYKKISIESHSNYDGYMESCVNFVNAEGKKLNVFYPEHDYSIGDNFIRYDKNIDLTWLDFFHAVENGNVMKYEGISEEN